MKTEIIVVIFVSIGQITGQLHLETSQRWFENYPGKWDLHEALQIGANENKIRTLIEYGADINLADKNGLLPIHWAIIKRFQNIVLLLVERGGRNQLDTRDTLFGNTPLHTALDRGNLEAAKVLVMNGANTQIKNNRGKTSLDIALEKGYNIGELSWLVGNAGDGSSYQQDSLDIARKRGYNIKNTVRAIAEHSLESALETIQTECAIYAASAINQILGGKPVENNEEFPWMVALGYRGPNRETLYGCGGTIISKRFVLTAAHCTLPQSDAPLVEVRLGSINLLDRNAQRLPIKEIIRHENYNRHHKKNDIALIRIDISEFTLEIRPACLETESGDLLNDRHYITGFGANSTDLLKRNHIKSNDLLKAELKAVRLEECKQVFGDRWNWAALRIDESQYCAKDPDGKVDSCLGDSGGAIQVFHNDPNLASIVGIISFGVGCAERYPSVYTRVSYYLEWIADRVWPNGDI